jgi:hypothetical protein
MPGSLAFPTSAGTGTRAKRIQAARKCQRPFHARRSACPGLGPAGAPTDRDGLGDHEASRATWEVQRTAAPAGHHRPCQIGAATRGAQSPGTGHCSCDRGNSANFVYIRVERRRRDSRPRFASSCADKYSRRPYGVPIVVVPHPSSPSGVPLPPQRRVSAVPRIPPLTPLLPWPPLSVAAARTQLTVRGLDTIL